MGVKKAAAGVGIGNEFMPGEDMNSAMSRDRALVVLTTFVPGWLLSRGREFGEETASDEPAQINVGKKRPCIGFGPAVCRVDGSFKLDGDGASSAFVLLRTGAASQGASMDR